MRESLTLQKRRLQGKTFEGYDVSGLDLSSAVAFGATFRDCIFNGCEFSLADFQAVTLDGCQFISCRMPIVNFHRSTLRRVRFERCDLRQAIFAGSHPIDRVVFEGCSLQYASFYDSTVQAVAWLHSNLHGSDLRFMEAGDLNFEGSNLWNAQVRIGCSFFDSNFDERSANLFVGMAARLHPNSKKADQLREMAGPGYNVVSRLMDRRDSL